MVTRWLIALVVGWTLAAQAQAPFLQHRRTASRPAAGAASYGPVGVESYNSTNTIGGGTLTVDVTVNGENRLILAGVTGYDGTRVTNSWTCGGNAMSHIYATNFYDGANGMTAWRYYLAPAAGSSTVQVVLDGAPPAAMNLFVIGLTNVNQASPIGNIVAQYIHNTSATVGITNTISAAADDLVLSLYGSHPNSATYTYTGTSETLLDSKTPAGASGGRVTTAPGAASVQMSVATTFAETLTQIIIGVNKR